MAQTPTGNEQQDRVVINRQPDVASPKPLKQGKLHEFQKAPAPSIKALEGDFFLTATQSLGKNEVVSLLVRAGAQPERGGTNRTVAKLAKERAQAELKEADKPQDQEKWRNLIAVAEAYLEKVCDGPGRIQGCHGGYHLAPEKQAELMATAHASMLDMKEKAARAQSERIDSLARINDIHSKAAGAVSDIHRKINEGREASRKEHFATYLKILSKVPGEV